MKICCITGSNGGIAKQLKKYLLQLNVKIYGCSRTKDNFKHKNYFHKVLDATDQQQVRGWFEYIYEFEKKIDILICLAGTTSGGNLVFNIDHISEFQSDFANTFKSTIICNKEILRYFIKSKSGSIINFSSLAYKKNLIGSSIYSSSKSAVTSFTKILARENIKFNINANIIIPSLIENSDTIKRGKKWRDSILSLQDTVDSDSAKSIANLILFLNQKNNLLITGQEISIGTIL